MTRKLAPIAAGLLLMAALPKLHAAEQTATNGILSVIWEDTPGTEGLFTVRTGTNHPVPDENILFPVNLFVPNAGTRTGFGYITLRDVGANTMWVNTAADRMPSQGNGMAGYVNARMQTQPTSLTPLGSSGFRTTYTLANFTVVQDVVINGTDLTDSNIRHTTTITNSTGASRQFGLRYLWDWMIADSDNAIARPRNPDGAFSDVFAGYTAPQFTHYEMVDNLSSPTFSVFGTVSGGGLSPAPTPPEQFRYASWADAYDSAWQFDVLGSGSDSAVTYYWGFDTPITLAPGESMSFHQYIGTDIGALGGPEEPPPGAAHPIPTLSQWALMLLASLVGLGTALSRRWR